MFSEQLWVPCLSGRGLHLQPPSGLQCDLQLPAAGLQRHLQLHPSGLDSDPGQEHAPRHPDSEGE